MCEYLKEWGSEWMIVLLREGVNNGVSERIFERWHESVSIEMHEQ